MNRNMLIDVDYLAFQPRIGAPMFSTMVDVSNNLASKGFHLEIHGLETTLPIKDDAYGQSIDTYKKATGKKGGKINKGVIYSTDGDMKMDAKIELLLASEENIDAKCDAMPGQPIFPNNFPPFWEAYFPPYSNVPPK